MLKTILQKIYKIFKHSFMVAFGFFSSYHHCCKSSKKSYESYWSNFNEYRNRYSLVRHNFNDPNKDRKGNLMYEILINITNFETKKMGMVRKMERQKFLKLVNI